MAIQFRAVSSNDYGTETEATLRRGEGTHDRLGVIGCNGGETLLNVAELRELAQIATLIADQIEADG